MLKEKASVTEVLLARMCRNAVLLTDAVVMSFSARICADEGGPTLVGRFAVWEWATARLLNVDAIPAVPELQSARAVGKNGKMMS